MITRNPRGKLTNDEESMVKALLQKGYRNQDIQHLLNIGRKATINSARVTEVKQDDAIRPASDNKVQRFLVKQETYDPKTELNAIDNERLIRAREAMLLAVQAFNSPTLRYRTEVFSIMAIIAWTHLLHEFYIRKNMPITDKKGHTLALRTMLGREDCPLNEVVKKNLNHLKKIRDNIEHNILGQADTIWFTLFQACCLNFDNSIRNIFGEKLSLQNELSFALQFAKLDIEQISKLQEYDIPANIEALDKRLEEDLTEEQRNDTEYRFRVNYRLDSASKGQAHIKFVYPDSKEASEGKTIVLKPVSSDGEYPYKPKEVCELVQKESGEKFTLNKHTDAWKKHRTRPPIGSANPEQTDKRFCLYNKAHKGYAYSKKWVDFLVKEIKNTSSS